MGWSNHVVPDGELMAKTEELAADLASGPTFAFGMAKKLFHMASGPSYEDFLDYEAFVQPQLDQTEDHREGVAAFREKRKPNFVGTVRRAHTCHCEEAKPTRRSRSRLARATRPRLLRRYAPRNDN